jgi:hypothetical protein
MTPALRLALPARLLASVALATSLAPWLVDAPTAHARLVARTIRLEGYVEKAPESSHPEAKWTVRAGDRNFVLQITRLQVVSGPGAPSDVIQALKPYRAAAFKIVGDEETVAKLVAAPAGSEIELQGVLRLGPARTLLLASLEIDGPD